MRLAPRAIGLLTVTLLGLSLSACGSGSSPSTTQAQSPENAQSAELIWSENDDAGTVLSNWESEGLSFDVEDTDGNTLNTAEVDDCVMDSVDAASATPDDFFSVIVNCSQRDWEAREGTAWEEFASAYADGYESGCAAVFDLSPTGSLYLDDWEYSSLDCDSGSEYDADISDLVPDEVPDAPSEAGEAAGAYDGCMNLFSNVGGPLNYGTDSVDESICDPAALAAPSVDAGFVEPNNAMGFESPTGNIRCLYDPTNDAVLCYAANLRQAVSLDASGAATELGHLEISRQPDTLNYGSVWTRSVFTCESSTEGILCAANVGSYGGYFAVNRDGIVARSD